MRAHWAIAVVAVIATIGTRAQAEDEEMTVSQMLAETTNLVHRQAELQPILEDSIAKKKELQQQQAVLDGDVESLNKEIDQHNAVCKSGSDDACRAGLASIQPRAAALQKRQDEITAADQARADKVMPLLAEFQSNEKRLSLLHGMLAHLPLFQNRHCEKKDTLEAAQQCFQVTFDGAKDYADKPLVIKPEFSMTPNSPEDAIQRYKDSGAPTGPQTVKTKEPPPPGQ